MDIGEAKTIMRHIAAGGICPMCRERILEEQETFQDRFAEISHVDCLRGHFKIGDRVKVRDYMVDANEGRIGRIIGIQTELPSCYWVRFHGPHPDIGCVWDYYFDELEALDSWQRI